MSGSNVIEQPSGFTRREVIDLMHKLDLPCRVEAVEKIMYLAQRRALAANNLNDKQEKSE
ncbi:hypothetical protein FHX57_006777 [Paraburkholderia tropica]|uniref:hypothetical protein n=1 Tax=Paraburkholderia tropica TaxID=92647 RepID=UPI00160F1299|nr:hypothetical protein [Paraburkholderia tropica]MBB3004395.1 hypothetical protein [Paraburkholderia tropica]